MNENKRNLRLSRTIDAEVTLRAIDEQERAIIKALIRDPRQSNNYISKVTGVPTPTVRRKRQRLEDEAAYRSTLTQSARAAVCSG